MSRHATRAGLKIVTGCTDGSVLHPRFKIELSKARRVPSRVLCRCE